jgi:L-alanine-DL-glutamate epimerase-like enolase superfamily enzyme
LRIKKCESFLLRMPLDRVVADSQMTITHKEIIVVHVITDNGIKGVGYTGTLGYGGSVIKEALDSLLLPDLVGEDPFNVKEIWQKMSSGRGFLIGRTGAVMMAQSCVDVALWDIIAKSLERPLWQVLGGSPDKMPCYSKDAQWLNSTIEETVDSVKAELDKGYVGVKVKIGRPNAEDDWERLRAVRKAVGDDVLLMTDVNQKWDLNTAIYWGKRLEDLNLYWLEEPMPAAEVGAHKLLRERISIPIALGESLFAPQAFKDYIVANAVDFVQLQVIRMGGITPWLEVAALAKAFNLRVCPHAGDSLQVHQHLIRAISNRGYLEGGEPLTQGIWKYPIKIEDGYCVAPTEPGASTEFNDSVFQNYLVKN